MTAEASPLPGYPKRCASLSGCESPTLRVDAEGLKGPVTADLDFQQHALSDFCRAVAVIKGLHGTLIAPGRPSCLSYGQGNLLAPLLISYPERPLSRLLTNLH